MVLVTLLYAYISLIWLSGPFWTFREVSLYPSWPRHFLRPIWSNKNQGFGVLVRDLKKSEYWVSIKNSKVAKLELVEPMTMVLKQFSWPLAELLTHWIVCQTLLTLQLLNNLRLRNSNHSFEILENFLSGVMSSFALLNEWCLNK